MSFSVNQHSRGIVYRKMSIIRIMGACQVVSVVSNFLQPRGPQPMSWDSLFMGFSRQEYRRWLPFPPPVQLSHPEIGVSYVSCIGSQIIYHQPHLRRRQWQPTPVLLPEKSHGWRSLVGCSPWGREESDRTDVTQQQQQPHLGSPIRIINCINFFLFHRTVAFSGTTLGLAYISTMCSPDFSAGIIKVCLKIKLLVLQLKSIKGCCAESMEKILFFSFNLLMWEITLIEFQILPQSCIFTIDPAWS